MVESKRRQSGGRGLVVLCFSVLAAGCGGAGGDSGGGETTPEADDPSLEVQQRASELMGHAGMALSEGDEQGALGYYLGAAALWDESGEVSVDRAEAHFLAADLAYQMGQSHQAIDEYDVAVKIYLRFKGNSKIKAANALNNMGTILKRIEETDRARSCWQRALEIYEQAPDNLKSERNMAKIRQNLSDLTEGF